MTTWPVPQPLHDVLGERASTGGVAVAVVAGLSAVVVLATRPEIAGVGWPWRFIASILVADIAAGCVANFTRSTNDFYAIRPRNRWVFLTVHVHVLVLAAVLGQPLGPAAAVWYFTVVGGSVVNLLAGRPCQVLVAGTVLAVGCMWIPLLPGVPAGLTAVYLLFLVKVGFAFAADHYRPSAAG
ncbi:MAG: hypothetical protein ACRCYR_15845 [Phycicoccus sp.]